MGKPAAPGRGAPAGRRDPTSSRGERRRGSRQGSGCPRGQGTRHRPYPLCSGSRSPGLDVFQHHAGGLGPQFPTAKLWAPQQGFGP